MSHKFNVLFQKDENGYFAFCPELKGCHSQGDTFEEAQSNIREAIELYVETMSQDEINELLPSRELITTTMEVELA
ncbi:MAG: type II toxin-antitoxin system HicB family antitoxin [Arcicella sp.]|jgi:predicted RNase H-like HicB family nuclease|nr:type II toxin-antitoxin system HicB family antitoxin [Arcicella sp.]